MVATIKTHIDVGVVTEMEEIKEAGRLNRSTFKKYDTVLDGDGICTCLLTREVGCPTMIKEEKRKLRVRKLTPDECMRLMGFEKKDVDAMRGAGQSNANIYHAAGDSIVVSVLMGIFGKMLGMDPKGAMEAHADRLAAEGGEAAS